MILERNKSYKGDCIELMQFLPSESVDVILTDPPYLYLKNQKLDRPFNEAEYFKQVKRVLKKDGFIILFGRGSSFYRWNTILADLGFTFKEEIIWDKSYCSSPLMAMSRVHETVSIHTKGNGTINKVKVPYLEMKGHDIDAIVTDVKRLKTTFKNSKSLDAVIEFLEKNYLGVDGVAHKCIITQSQLTKPNRCVSVMNSIQNGMNEKSIIKHIREHYTAIHPTQKPPRLLERLLALVCKVEPNQLKPLVLDTFRGSASTDIACMDFGVDCISFEIDDEYFDKGEKRKAEHRTQKTEGNGGKV